MTGLAGLLATVRYCLINWVGFLYVEERAYVLGGLLDKLPKIVCVFCYGILPHENAVDFCHLLIAVRNGDQGEAIDYILVQRGGTM